MGPIGPIKLFDTHAHLHFAAYQDDPEGPYRRASEAGIGVITVGTRLDTSQAAVAYAEAHEGIWATIGVHPCHSVDQEHVDEQELPTAAAHGTEAERIDLDAYRELALSSKVVAIGECGLDFYRIPEGANAEAYKQQQRDALRVQFDLASELELPVVIHCRDAHADLAEMIEQSIASGGLPRRGVIHCFTGTLEEAERHMVNGFFISFSGIITFEKKNVGAGLVPALGRPQGSPLQQVVRRVPLDRLLVETDAPYLAPVPFRGKRNEPAYVEQVARKVAELKGVAFEEVCEAVVENVGRVFRIQDQ